MQLRYFNGIVSDIFNKWPVADYTYLLQEK